MKSKALRSADIYSLRISLNVIADHMMNSMGLAAATSPMAMFAMLGSHPKYKWL